MANQWRKLHRLSAFVLSIFLLAHLGNHVVGLGGQQAHRAYMGSARTVYRHPVVEPLLLSLVLWQVVSGVRLLLRAWRTRAGTVAWLQALSGLYLAIFIVIHIGAVLIGRYMGLDTDFRFAAAGFHVAPWGWFFAPYYFFAVASLMTHIGCAMYWSASGSVARYRWALLSAFVVIGIGGGIAIDLSLAGKLHAVDVPAAYRSLYGR